MKPESRSDFVTENLEPCRPLPALIGLYRPFVSHIGQAKTRDCLENHKLFGAGILAGLPQAFRAKAAVTPVHGQVRGIHERSIVAEQK